MLIRNTFADRMPDPLWHRWFLRARTIKEELFPSLAEVAQAFATAGMHPVALTSVRHRLADRPADYAARLRLRASSIFDQLTEQEITEGFAALDADLATHPDTGPIEEDCDLLILAG